MKAYTDVKTEDMTCPECDTKGLLSCGGHLPRKFQGRYCYAYCIEHGIFNALEPTSLSCTICGKCDTMRHYDIDGRRYPSVTAILNFLPKPEGLKIWQSRTPDHKQISRRAMVQGTILHYRVANHYARKVGLPPQPLELSPGFPKPDKEMGETVSLMLSFFHDWDKQYNPKPLAVEQVVHHVDLGYAGTGDFVCEIDGEVWLIDWKTCAKFVPNKKPYENYNAQLWAYQEALRRMERFEIQRIAVVYLAAEGFVFAESKGDRDRFMKALKLYEASRRAPLDE